MAVRSSITEVARVHLFEKVPMSIKFTHAHYHYTGPLIFAMTSYFTVVYFCCTYRHFLEREYVFVSFCCCFVVVVVVVVFLFYPG